MRTHTEAPRSTANLLSPPMLKLLKQQSKGRPIKEHPPPPHSFIQPSEVQTAFLDLVVVARCAEAEYPHPEKLNNTFS